MYQVTVKAKIRCYNEGLKYIFPFQAAPQDEVDGKKQEEKLTAKSSAKSSTSATDRLSEVENELKKLKESHSAGGVEYALKQVRNLALRSSTDNGVLLAAMESLHDAAVITNHADAPIYKMTLKSCRENDDTGYPLHTLITKMIGDEASKKAQAAIDAWQKSARKAKQMKEEAKGKKNSSTDENGDRPSTSTWFPSFASRGRGSRQYAGRGRRGAASGCFICKSPEHFMRNCPFNSFGGPSVGKKEQAP